MRMMGGGFRVACFVWRFEDLRNTQHVTNCKVQLK